jgi:signal transduction histidine kinase
LADAASPEPLSGGFLELGIDRENRGRSIRLPFEVLLTDRPGLFQNYGRRVWFTATLILLAVIAAMIGIAQTWSNLRRQIALNEMKTSFVSSVSHELRAPIASVRLMAENLQQGKVSGEAKLKEYVGFIGQECRRLSSLIENVLDFSRIEQGRKEYELEPTDLTKLVEDTVRLMKPYAEEREVKLATFTGDTGSVAQFELNLDGRAIQQALINLIDNAIKPSPAGESVEVRLHRGTGLKPVLLSVTDRGPGIPESEQRKIFERFYRRGSELRRETQGIGIGLSIVKHIVEGHGGKVRVGSKPGAGSRFALEFQPQADTDKHT